jgi:c-di-GMP-binding flagellar brake protein YcgR
MQQARILHPVHLLATHLPGTGEPMAEKKQHFWIDRQYTRIGAILPCNVALPAGQAAPVEMLNLSAGGMKFSCSKTVFSALLPENQRTPGLVQDVLIEIEFQLTLSGADITTIRAPAAVIHTERLAQDCYHIGVQFQDLSTADSRTIEQYIAQLQQTQP